MSLKEILDREIRKLVKHLTGFDDDDENLTRFENYALSNILYHRCLTVDAQKVRKSADGIVTKFFVHGHLQASKRLAELVERLVSHEQFEDTSRRDDPWAMLSLLLNLSNNPTNNLPRDEPIEPIEERSESDENFDWGAYLMEGIEPFKRPYNDASDDSSGLSLSDDSGVDAVTRECTTPSVLSAEGSKSVDLEHTNKNEELTDIINKSIEAEKWLKENVQNCWWITGDMPDEVHSKYPCADLAKMWEEHSIEEQSNDCCRQRTLKISEYKVMREVLFMLHSPATTLLFHQEYGRYVVTNNITIPSLTKDAVKNYLESLCEYINIVNELRKFREEVDAYYGDDSRGKMLPTFTYESYSAALHQFLLDFGCFVSEIEERVRKQENINTLCSLISELRPKLKELSVVYHTHVEATQGWKESPSWLIVAKLLTVLFRAGVSATDGCESRNIMKLFLKSFRPYLDIINTWLIEGQLMDFRKEFIITRNEEVVEGTWEMWEKGYVLHPYVENLRLCGIEPLPLLEDIAKKVLHAGKNIELLKKLSKTGEFSQLIDMKGSFYKELLTNLLEQLPSAEEEKQKDLAAECPELTAASALCDVAAAERSTLIDMGNLEDTVTPDHSLLGKLVENLFCRKKQLGWRDASQEEEQKILDKMFSCKTSY